MQWRPDEQNGWPAGVCPVWTPFVCCHILHGDGEAVIIDTGFLCQRDTIRAALHQLNLPPTAVRAILLTHGHLDHVHNLAWLKSWTGAPIYAHPAEQAHIDGVFPYSGASRWCGRLERGGKTLFGYRPETIDSPLADGQELPFWGGLRVIHLPGHTAGHCGFFSSRHRLLFAGDLFASYRPKAVLPASFLNARPSLIPGSLEKARRLGAKGMLPNHYLGFDPVLHRRRFDKLCARMQARAFERAAHLEI